MNKNDEVSDIDGHSSRTPESPDEPTADASAAQPRLADVARRAGVSTATVSRALNQPHAVTAELRDRVHAAVDALGYVPHGPARALASRRSNTIGAVVPTIDNAIFARNIQSLQARLFEAGRTLFLASSDYDYAREQREVQSLVERGIDGLILVGEQRNQAVYRLLENKRVPYVTTWIFHEDSPHPCVGFDNHQAAYQVASYLLDIGHRDIAMVAGIREGNDRAAARAPVRWAPLRRGSRARFDREAVDLPRVRNPRADPQALAGFGSRGRPRPRSAMMFFWIWAVPPPMMRPRVNMCWRCQRPWLRSRGAPSNRPPSSPMASRARAFSWWETSQPVSFVTSAATPGKTAMSP